MRTYTYSLSAFNTEIITDLEVTYTYRVVEEGGEPGVLVNSVAIGASTIWQESYRAPTTLYALLGIRIAEVIENDEDEIAEVLAEEGWAYTGHGSNDPDGRWTKEG